MVRKPPKALQDEWDRILKANGFEDIEDRHSQKEMLKTWHSTQFARRFNPERFEARKAYFDDATEFLNTHYFRTNLERTIWELHAEGKSLREIAKETGEVSKDGALKIIKALLAEMKNPQKKGVPVTEEQKNKLYLTYGYLLALEVPPEILVPLKEILYPEPVKKRA